MKLTKRVAVIAAAVAIAGLTMGANADMQSASAQSDVISDSAGVYATFQSDVTDVRRTQISSVDELHDTITNLGGHNPNQLTNGVIAYSALVASQDPAFRAAVQDVAGYYGNDQILLGMRNDPRYARSLAGASSAVTASLSAIEADARRLRGAGSYVHDQGYTLRNQSWAQTRIPNASRLADTVKTSALAGRPVRANIRAALSSSDFDLALASAGQSGAPSLWENVSSAASAIRVPTVNIGYTGRSQRLRAGNEPMADKIATLAAYRVIGTAGTPAHTIRTAMNDRSTKNCINMAQLELQGCVAGQRDNSELPFCIGQHALTDVGACLENFTQ